MEDHGQVRVRVSRQVHRHSAQTPRWHDDQQELSNPFPVTNGVKQGCVLAPTLFSMVSSAMLHDSFQNTNTRISFIYRFDDDEVNIRIVKVSAAFGRLLDSVWERAGIKQETKLKVYQAVILPTFLYGCEAWIVYQRYARKLNHLHLSCLRKLLRITWQDRIPDTEVLSKANISSIPTLLAKAQLRWTGYVTRMPCTRLPKQVFFGELKNGK
ncbi:hypothetical protein SKAU_G00157050 [Synaphobranchus kaupii]|uniref:Reverse transcriptase domain-containing protein n=1 Tax=Synaphobranchus kaupii TaxID=118154 RepID=A0A9Q1FIB8_SYNKA|nr:hypothetical protein SKAU_G00157050 [Synaphobranchus kaupii]